MIVIWKPTSVEKHGTVMLNFPLQEKVRFKTFYWLLQLPYTAFALIVSTKTDYFVRYFFYIFSLQVRKLYTKSESLKLCVSISSQNFNNFQGTYLRRNFAMMKLVSLWFTGILLMILKLLWTFITILWNFWFNCDSSLCILCTYCISKLSTESDVY